MTDSVNHPPHYTAGPTEVIDMLEQAVAHADDPVAAGLQWQALKYLHRLWLKGNPAQDAAKARWYINRLVDRFNSLPR